MPGEGFRGGPKIPPILGKGGFQQAIDGLRGQLVHHGLRHLHGVGGNPFPPARPFAAKQDQRLFGGGCIPDRQFTQHMRRIRRGQARDHREPARDQTAQSGQFGPAARRVRQADRPIGQPDGNYHFARVQPFGDRIKQRHHKPARPIGWGLSCKCGIQRTMHQRRVINRQQRHWHQPFRPQPQRAVQPVQQMHFAITAQPGGAHRHSLDHGAIRANAGALGVNRGFAAAQQADICGGATDVTDQSIGFSGQPRCARDTGRRAGQDGFYRPIPGEARRNQRTVAAHHHQPGGNADAGHVVLTRIDQPGDQADQAGVQHSGQGAFGATQSGGKFVATGHRFTGAGNDQVMRSQFMRGVAGGETGGHGKGRNLGAKVIQGTGKAG